MLYVVAFAGVLGAAVVPDRRGAWLAAASALVALVATGAMQADLLQPFEAIRPRAGLPPVGVLCPMELAAGAWLATAAWVFAAVVAWRRTGPRPAWASRRLAGAILIGLISVTASWIWAVFLVDAAVDAESVAGQAGVWTVLVALFAASALVAWGGMGGRRMVARGLFAIGGLMLGGPLVLLLLRGAALARPHAAILADWNEQNGLLGPLFVGSIAVNGLIVLAVGAFVRRARRREPSDP